jgi:hypothetical protein
MKWPPNKWWKKTRKHTPGGIEVNRGEIGPWEQFGMAALKNFSDQIALLSHKGFFACQNEKGLYANRSEVGEWERYKIIKNNDGTISLKNPYHNKYVVAIGGGGSVAGCDRDKIGPWEKFKLVYNKNGTVSLMAKEGQYFSVQP